MEILIIGCGISGLSAAIEAAESGDHVTLVSPYPSERAQSVMAAGGINACLNKNGENDTPLDHVRDTLKGGCFIENEKEVQSLCEAAPGHIAWLESLGVVFSRDEDLSLSQRQLGGHCHKRTAFAGACTGKQIVTALIQKCREYECAGRITRRLGYQFHSAMIRGGKCYGVLFYSETEEKLVPVYADCTIAAVGGQNKLFGKTTGSESCDGYAVGRLFAQGVELRNLEFIQYHPTTIETEFKRMLISEGARSEGGRLFYLKDGKRVYFMEDKYGEKGNLMPRDVVSREIYACPSQVYLDIAFLGEKTIRGKLEEIRWLCEFYLGLDVTKEPIPVAPGIHFFMGGIRTDSRHETCIRNLYAVGECASRYHGANRLGGNSLLAAVHSGRVAAKAIAEKRGTFTEESVSFEEQCNEFSEELTQLKQSVSRFPCMYVYRELAESMNESLGIIRDREGLSKGLREVEFLAKIVGKLKYDSEVSMYDNYRIPYLILLAKAVLQSAIGREESRGAHFRSDFPETKEEYQCVSVVRYLDGEIKVSFEKDGEEA